MTNKTHPMFEAGTPQIKANLSWRWLVMRQTEVAELLYALLPYLRVKREQAVAALADIKNREKIRFIERSNHESSITEGSTQTTG